MLHAQFVSLYFIPVCCQVTWLWCHFLFGGILGNWGIPSGRVFPQTGLEREPLYTIVPIAIVLVHGYKGYHGDLGPWWQFVVMTLWLPWSMDVLSNEGYYVEINQFLANCHQVWWWIVVLDWWDIFGDQLYDEMGYVWLLGYLFCIATIIATRYLACSRVRFCIGWDFVNHPKVGLLYMGC